MSREPGITLDYAPLRRRRFWLIWRLLLVVLLLSGTSLTWHFWPPLKAEAQRRWHLWSVYRAQQACLDDLRPEEEVVYEETPTAPPDMSGSSTSQPSRPFLRPAIFAPLVQVTVARTTSPLREFVNLFNNGLTPAPMPVVVRGAAGWPPSSAAGQRLMLQRAMSPYATPVTIARISQSSPMFAPIPPPTASGAMVFVHERQTDSHQRRLVVVTANSSVLHIVVYTAAGRQAMPLRLMDCDVLSIDRSFRPAAFRLYAGQPDPTDPTRFTIRFDAGDRTGSIVGRLRSDTLAEFTAPGWIDDSSYSWRPTAQGFDPLTWRGQPQQIGALTPNDKLPAISMTFISNDALAVAHPDRIDIVDPVANRMTAKIPIDPPRLAKTTDVASYLSFAPDGLTLFIWREPNHAQVVNPKTGHTLWERDLPTGITGFPTPLSYSMDGSRLLAKVYADDPWRLESYDARSGDGPKTEMAMPAREVSNPKYRFLTRALFASGSRSLFATISDVTASETALLRYNFDTELVDHVDVAGSRVAASMDAVVVLGATSVTRYSAATLKTTGEISDKALDIGMASTAMASRDGQFVVITSPGCIYAVELDTKRVIRAPNPPVPRPATAAMIFETNLGAISPNNQRFVLYEAPGQAYFYDLSVGVDPPLAKIRQSTTMP